MENKPSHLDIDWNWVVLDVQEQAIESGVRHFEQHFDLEEHQVWVRFILLQPRKGKGEWNIASSVVGFRYYRFFDSDTATRFLEGMWEKMQEYKHAHH